MKNLILFSVALMFACTISKAQTTAMQFTGSDCNGNPVDLFADLDAGKTAVLFYYMPNCGSCPPPAKKIQAMASKINAQYPGMVKAFAFPFQNSTACTYSSTWVTSNSLSELFTPMEKGAAQVAYYGGFGMPTVVLVGGKDHKILFSTMSFSTSDTSIMRDKILEVLGTTGVNELPSSVSSFSVFPNPASDNATITIDLKESTNVQIDVTDLAGKQVAIIMNEKPTGAVTKQFNTTSLPNGNYLVRLQVNGKSYTQKLSITH